MCPMAVLFIPKKVFLCVKLPQQLGIITKWVVQKVEAANTPLTKPSEDDIIAKLSAERERARN